MTEYTKVPAWDLGPGKDLARRFRDAEGLFFAVLITSILTVMGGIVCGLTFAPSSSITNPLAGSLGFAGLAVMWLFVWWLRRAPGFYVEVEGADYDGILSGGSPAAELRMARKVWWGLPDRERVETQPLIEAAYAAARLGGDEGESLIRRRRMVLEDVAREVIRRETTARRAVMPPQGDDLAVGHYVVEELRTRNDAVDESDAELRRVMEDLRGQPVDPEDTR